MAEAFPVARGGALKRSHILSNLTDALRILEGDAESRSSGLAISAIVRAIKALNRSSDTSPLWRSGGLAGWQCAEIRKYVSEKIQARIAVSELAGIVNLSTSHFCRAFRASFECSPTQFIMRLRVDLSRDMLLNSSEPLSRIASECGFSDQSHFSRIFHEMTGESPWRWRKERLTARCEGGFNRRLPAIPSSLSPSSNV
jgi:AraC-like DNA-binding protein